jgi:hypothetical protein
MALPLEFGSGGSFTYRCYGSRGPEAMGLATRGKIVFLAGTGAPWPVDGQGGSDRAGEASPYFFFDDFLLVLEADGSVADAAGFSVWRACLPADSPLACLRVSRCLRVAGFVPSICFDSLKMENVDCVAPCGRPAQNDTMRNE